MPAKTTQNPTAYSTPLRLSSPLSTLASMAASATMSLFVVLFLLLLNAHSSSSSSTPISSHSILVSLLDSPHTDFAELIEKALLLQPLEHVVGTTNITIVAPKNAFLDRNLDPDFKRFLLEPGNLNSLQRLLQFHVIPHRIASADWGNKTFITLSSDPLRLVSHQNVLRVDLATVLSPDSIVRPDGVVHGIDGLLIPKPVQDAYSKWKRREVLAVLPESAPTVESYKAQKSKHSKIADPPAAPSLPWYYAMAPGPSLAPAPAPGPSGAHRWFDGESQVSDFIATLVHYGGYNEIADLLVNLTSLAPELAKLVSEGYRITLLAPNDEAMGELTEEHLSEPGAPEQILYYHIIPEYQTEESFYNAVKRFGKVTYDTLRIPHKVVAQEADGTVQFGHGEDAAHIYDHDIYIDGRISVQGIDKVLFPPEEAKKFASEEGKEEKMEVKKTNKKAGSTGTMKSRGLLTKTFCTTLGWLRQESNVSFCE